MTKLYITKNKLQELLFMYDDLSNDYPKPVLASVIFILTLIAIILAIFYLLAVVIGLMCYALLFWLDIILGKYIIKRIFKK